MISRCRLGPARAVLTVHETKACTSRRHAEGENDAKKIVRDFLLNNLFDLVSWRRAHFGKATNSVMFGTFHDSISWPSTRLSSKLLDASLHEEDPHTLEQLSIINLCALECLEAAEMR